MCKRGPVSRFFLKLVYFYVIAALLNPGFINRAYAGPEEDAAAAAAVVAAQAAAAQAAAALVQAEQAAATLDQANQAAQAASAAAAQAASDEQALYISPECVARVRAPVPCRIC